MEAKIKGNSSSTVQRCLFVNERDGKAEREEDKERQSVYCRDEGVCCVCVSLHVFVCASERERKVAELSGSLAVQPCSLCLAYR